MRHTLPLILCAISLLVAASCQPGDNGIPAGGVSAPTATSPAPEVTPLVANADEAAATPTLGSVDQQPLQTRRIPVPVGETPSGLPLQGLIFEREGSGTFFMARDSLLEGFYEFPEGTSLPSYSPLLVAPDNTRMAFMRYGDESASLETVTFEGQANLLYQWNTDYWFWSPSEWLGADLVSVGSGTFDGEVHLFSTEGGPPQIIPPAFPVDTPEGEIRGRHPDSLNSAPSFNLALDRALLERASPQEGPARTHELWDTTKRVRLWARQDCGDLSTAEWSPDGSRFAITLPPDLTCDPYGPKQGNLYVIDRNGDEALIAEGVIGQVSWSPDGSRIASWKWATPTLAISNASTRVTEFFEFQDSGLFSPDQFAVWSPSGRYIALNRFRPDDELLQRHRVLVLDLEEARTFIVLEDAYAVAWLSPPQ